MRGGEDVAGSSSLSRVPSRRSSGAGLDSATRGIKKMYDLAMRSESMTVAYEHAAFRHLDVNYKFLDGYIRLLGVAHQQGLLEQVETDQGMVPATDAVLQGALSGGLQFGKVKRGSSNLSAPRVVMKAAETEEYLKRKLGEVGCG